MGYEHDKQQDLGPGYKFDSPWEPIYKLNGKKDTVSIYLNEDARPSLFKVPTGLPQNIGDALGDVNPELASKMLLCCVYGLRIIFKGGQLLRAGLKQVKEKFYSQPTPEDILNGLDGFGLGSSPDIAEIKTKPQNSDGKTLLYLTSLVKYYLSQKTLMPEVRVIYSKEDANFLNELSGLGFDNSLITKIKKLPSDEFTKLRDSMYPLTKPFDPFSDAAIGFFESMDDGGCIGAAHPRHYMSPIPSLGDYDKMVEQKTTPKKD